MASQSFKFNSKKDVTGNFKNMERDKWPFGSCKDDQFVNLFELNF